MLICHFASRTNNHNEYKIISYIINDVKLGYILSKINIGEILHMIHEPAVHKAPAVVLPQVKQSTSCGIATSDAEYQLLYCH